MKSMYLNIYEVYPFAATSLVYSLADFCKGFILLILYVHITRNYTEKYVHLLLTKVLYGKMYSKTNDTETEISSGSCGPL